MTARAQGGFAYAQARMQARLGRRAAAPDLQRLQSSRDLSACLQQLRGSPLAHHAARLAAGMDAHEIERRLREGWCATVVEVSGWLPHAWQPALLWLRWLPWLAGLQKLARGGRPAGWMRDDPVLGRVIVPGAAPDRSDRSLSHGPQPLVTVVASHGDVAAAWLEHWLQLWPAGDRGGTGLSAIVRPVRRAVGLLAASESAFATRETRSSLRKTLLHAFRRHPLAPEAAVAYLGLEALDLLEIRGTVTARAALAEEAT